eukprot:GEZU01005849.1.p2 GENE.GEZU01005849.1~~GEZU01005849.1.p2  ORF type:complete len:417 (+),score=133.88 GEZU01005849.1:160-1410(+)
MKSSSTNGANMRSTTASEEELQRYLKEKGVPELLSSIIENLCLDRPDDIVDYIIEYLQKHHVKKGPVDPAFARSLEKYSLFGKKAETEDKSGYMDDSDDDDWKDEKEHEIDEKRADAIRRRYSTTHTRRPAFSAEAEQERHLENFGDIYIPKTDEERANIEAAVSNNVLFSNLESDDLKKIYDAMFERRYKAGETIIAQGDEGDNFYVVDQGYCDVFVDKGDGPEKVGTVAPGGTFGELALIYGKPRAATVKAQTDVRVWAIGRETYRKILLNQTQTKRRQYEEFLKKVPILESLTDYERLTIADALVPATFKDGEVIVRQGDPGYSFFIIVDGEVTVTQETPDRGPQQLATLGRGSIFGEMALLLNQPRAATVTAKGPVKCVKLDRKSFNRVLGPCEDILKRNMQKYNQIMMQNI